MGFAISSLKIEGFRALKQIQVNELGRINLITGKNNTGKSSLLEAIRILTSGGAATVFQDILRLREENFFVWDETLDTEAQEKRWDLLHLFHGFPNYAETSTPISIESSGLRKFAVILKFDFFFERVREDGSRSLVKRHNVDLFSGDNALYPDEESAIPALVIESGGGTRLLPADFARRYARLLRTPKPTSTEESGVRCVFVGPYGGETTRDLGQFWDRIALTDLESHVVGALQVIDPYIRAVSMIGGDRARQERTAIVRAANINRPVPLKSYGDGLNRLFGIILSLVNARDGILLIDEFENGMHHTVQLDAWRTIFRLATELNIQVFATSHNWDAIEAFQKAAAETPEEGALIRLTRKGDDVIPTLFREHELAIATREGIEVR